MLLLILLCGGVASLGYGLYVNKFDDKPGAMGVDLPSAKAAEDAAKSNPPTPPDPTDGLRRGTPPELAAAVQSLILTGTDPGALEQMATMVENLGYTDLGSALRMRARELRSETPPAPSPSPTPPQPTPTPSIPGFDPNLLPSGNPLLRQGSTGVAVQAWQQFLLSQGVPIGAADGIFGPNTKTATLNFQKSQGLSADGVVGPATVAAARALLGR